MKYYSNYSVKGCNEILLKGLNYKKVGNYYNVNNHCNEKEFKKTLQLFKEYKLMVFIITDYDEFFYLGISDSNSTSIDNEISICPYDPHNDTWFIDK